MRAGLRKKDIDDELLKSFLGYAVVYGSEYDRESVSLGTVVEVADGRACIYHESDGGSGYRRGEVTFIGQALPLPEGSKRFESPFFVETHERVEEIDENRASHSMEDYLDRFKSMVEEVKNQEGIHLLNFNTFSPASDEEIADNVRARSARLRIAERAA